jgi:hypothetical protein
VVGLREINKRLDDLEKATLGESSGVGVSIDYSERRDEGQQAGYFIVTLAIEDEKPLSRW